MMPENAAERGNAEMPPIVIDKDLGFTRPITIKALEYWKSRKGDRAMPSRADISPSALRSVLPHIALVDVPAAGEAPTHYVVRVAGDAITQVFGPLNGKAIDAHLPPELLERWVVCLDAVRISAAPARIASRVVYQDKTWLQAEVFLAPLGQDGRVVMLFAAMDIWPADQT